jgi:hypothetical protein
MLTHCVTLIGALPLSRSLCLARPLRYQAPTAVGTSQYRRPPFQFFIGIEPPEKKLGGQSPEARA